MPNRFDQPNQRHRDDERANSRPSPSGDTHGEYRPGRRAMREWMDTPPAASGAGNAGDMVNGRSNPNTSD